MAARQRCARVGARPKRAIVAALHRVADQFDASRLLLCSSVACDIRSFAAPDARHIVVEATLLDQRDDAHQRLPELW